MSFIKNHWFNILIVLFIIGSMGLTLLVAISPKQDAQNRGFIPCTTKLADTIVSCQGQLMCSAKAILSNAWCDAKVVGHGFKAWLDSKQEKPWSNYIFRPELTEDESLFNEHTDLFYKENPNYFWDFQQLKKDYKALKENTHHD